jgi:hypothetical protein
MVGAAAGGLAAFAGAGIATLIGHASQALLADMAAGAVNGSVNGAAMGFATGFADPAESSGDIAKRALFSALIGGAVGAALGAVSHLFVRQVPRTSAPEGVPTGRPPPSPDVPPPPMTQTPSESAPGVQTPGASGAGPPPQAASPGALAAKGAQYYGEYYATFFRIQVGFSEQVVVPLFRMPLFQVLAVDLTVGSANLTDKYLFKFLQSTDQQPSVPVKF